MVKNCFLFSSYPRKTRREEFRFLLYEGFLAGFSIITTESSPDSKFGLSLPPLSPAPEEFDASLQLPERSLSSSSSFILTAIDRGTRRGSPGLLRAAAGGRQPTQSQCCRTGSLSRTKLQVAVAHNGCLRSNTGVYNGPCSSKNVILENGHLSDEIQILYINSPAQNHHLLYSFSSCRIKSITIISVFRHPYSSWAKESKQLLTWDILDL